MNFSIGILAWREKDFVYKVFISDCNDRHISIKGQIESSPALKSGTIDYDHHWTLNRGGILNIYGNLEYDDIARITGHPIPIKLIQFVRQFQVNEQTLRLLNEKYFIMTKSTRFRETFNGYGAFNDLQFLKYLST
ncbi:MAG: hypothetical protein IPP17_26800 [Bacteroidetes bacterium]|nr:hypothetical protein [Bacteroidota bacterium]